jgi:hypothetical protein
MLGSRSNDFFNKLFQITLFYCGILLLLFLTEAYFSNLQVFSEINLLNWDAAHYFEVMNDGYRNENVAFFPLFPLFWKFIHASASGISILNGLIYILSFAWLAEEFKFKIRNILLLASIPSLVFMFLPFSEAIFFATASLLLIGLKKENNLLIYSGLIVTSLARPVATIFIPAIIFTSFICRAEERVNLRKLVLQLLFCILGLFLVFTFQFYETGKWFTFFEYQKNWNNYLRLPHLPLSSWSGGYIVRLDAMAFFFGLAAISWLAYFLFKSIKNFMGVYNKPLIFSLCYLAFLTCTILFTKGGSFNSFNRYLFVSPFLIFALNHFLESQSFNWKNMAIVFIFSSLTWLLFASYVHIQYLLKFELLSVYLCVLFLCTQSLNKKISSISFIAVLVINVYFFVTFMHRFLSGEWVG